MTEAIIFDFDGVIVNSNPIKKNAFFDIFSHIKNSRKPIEEAIRKNPKKTRYGIIEEILKKLREKSLMEFGDLEAEREEEETELENPEIPGERPNAGESNTNIISSLEEDLTLKEYSNLQEIDGFNYTDYLIKILTRGDNHWTPFPFSSF